MEVKQAVAKAKLWLAEVLADEGIQNVGLEEVEFDDDQGLWLITLGFSRPWNSIRNAYTAISGEPTAHRSYRVVAVNDADGAIVSMKRREPAD